MKQVLEVIRCDLCGASAMVDPVTGHNDSKDTPPETVHITVNDTNFELEVCGGCGVTEALYGSTLSRILDVARVAVPKRGRKAKAELPFTCDHCDKKFKTQQGVRHHITRIHKAKAA